MVLSVPLSALPPELVAALLEPGGPTVAVVAALWYRISKLEEHLKSRIDRIDEDVSANSSLIYDRLLGQEYPTPTDQEAKRPDVDVEQIDAPTSRSD